VDITIHGTVRNSDREVIKVEISNLEIEGFIKSKAIASGVEGYMGKVWTHVDEEIVSVIIND